MPTPTRSSTSSPTSTPARSKRSATSSATRPRSRTVRTSPHPSHAATPISTSSRTRRSKHCAAAVPVTRPPIASRASCSRRSTASPPACKLRGSSRSDARLAVMAIPVHGRPLHRYTYAEYVALERFSTTKHEFLDGEIYAMVGGSEDHSAIAANVLAALVNAIGDRPCRAHTSDLRIYVEEVGLA